MGKRRIPGLFKRGSIWHIDKETFGRRVCESTGTGSLEEAEQYLVRRMEQIRAAQVFGVRPDRTFREAATRYLLEKQGKLSLADDKMHLKQLDRYIGDLLLRNVHIGSLQTFIEARKKQKCKTKTINLALGVVRHILNLAASEWIDENGLTWLISAPRIRLLPEHDRRRACPLNWDEQDRLFAELPQHLRRMALFKVNVGLRDTEVCRLRWEWECYLPELNTSVFVIPGWVQHVSESGETEMLHQIKNGEDRLVVLNDTAKEVIEEVRGIHPEFVFTYHGKPIANMNNSGWQHARIRAGLKHVRVHDLKHTFGRRLRSAGVSFEDRQDLLGHKSSRITTHYSAAEIDNLIEAANKVCDRYAQRPTLTMLRTSSRPVVMGVTQVESRKTPAKVVAFENYTNRKVG